MTEQTKEYLGLLAESVDGERFGRVVMAESDGSAVKLILSVSGPGTRGREQSVAIAPDDSTWRLFPAPKDIPFAAPRSCLRCQRLNFGPCISATCRDLT